MSERKFISREQLFDMLKKYNIGKKPLSSLLGWGETTVLLYCEMDTIPQTEYSERLYSLYTNKSDYLDLLMKNKDNLTGVAFRKTITAIHKPIIENRILYISQYIIDHSKTELSEAQLEVALSMAQTMCMRLYDSYLFEDVYQPTKGNGNAPYAAVAEAYKNNTFFNFRADMNIENMSKNLNISNKGNAKIALSDKEKEVLDYVMNVLSWYGERAFNSILLAERYRLFGPPSARIRRTLSNETLKELNDELLDQAKVKKMKDFEGFICKRIERLHKHTYV